jgi:hypothetical protein
MSERNVCAAITFIGEAHRRPEVGEPVRLHIDGGSWREGFRCISDPFSEGGKRRVWVAIKEEYRQVQREGRLPVGDTWPISQMAVTDD